MSEWKKCIHKFKVNIPEPGKLVRLWNWIRRKKTIVGEQEMVLSFYAKADKPMKLMVDVSHMNLIEGSNTTFELGDNKSNEE